MGGGGVWLSKKWLAPLFRGVHSSLAPTARPGSYAEKPLLRKAFCGFAVHPPGGLLLSLRDNSPCAAKSDYSLRGAKPSAASGGRSEAEAQRARERQEGPTGRRSATFANCIAAPEPPGVFRQAVSGSRRLCLRLPLFQDASTVRKGRWAWPPRRLPSTPLLTGLPPRCIRHWRRSAPPPLRRVFHQRQKGSAKARPHDLWGRAHETLAGRYAATAPRLGQSRCPRPTGSGGLNRPAAGYEPRATAPAVARRSPSA